MKTDLKGIAFLFLPICIMLGCESKMPVTETQSLSNTRAVAPPGPPPAVIYVGGEFKHPGI